MRTPCLGISLLLVLACGCAPPKIKSSSPAPQLNELPREHVTGIGGVFFKVNDPKSMAAWYRQNLGIQSQHGFAEFTWREQEHPKEIGQTTWALFPTNTPYFGSSDSSLMINYRVANLDRMVAQLRQRGVKIEKVEDDAYGRFAWITDPEGNRIELWEPKNQ